MTIGLALNGSTDALSHSSTAKATWRMSCYECTTSRPRGVLEVRGIRKVLARSGYDAVVGADCVWGIIVPGKWDHNREEAYVGTLRVVDDDRGGCGSDDGDGEVEKGRKGNAGGPRETAW